MNEDQLRPNFGMLVVDKPAGLSSQQVVYRVRQALKIRKAGHTGTLDPLATGVLPVALGSATKIIPFLNESEKIYEVTGRLGEVTDTYDHDGEILERKSPDGIGPDDIRGHFPQYLGEQTQTPPIYSAIKVKGRPLYSYARKGKTVEIPIRKVSISQLDLTQWNGPDFSLRVHCSRGTYIRSLVHDLGQSLGVGAHVIQLKRVQTGPFHLGQSLPLDIIQEKGWEAVYSKVISKEDCLAHFPMVRLEDETEFQRVLSGVPLRRLSQVLTDQGLANHQVALTYQHQIIALIKGQNSGTFRYQRVFRPEESKY